MFDLDYNGVPTLKEAEGTLDIELTEKHRKKEKDKKDKSEKEDEKEAEKKDEKEEDTDEPPVEEFEYKTKGRKVQDVFRIIATQLEVPRPLNNAQIKKLKDTLDDFNKQDEDRKRLNEAKNELESMIYNVKDKLDEESFERVTTEKEREEITALVGELQDWLDSGDFKNAKSATIYEKKKKV